MKCEKNWIFFQKKSNNHTWIYQLNKKYNSTKSTIIRINKSFNKIKKQETLKKSDKLLGKVINFKFPALITKFNFAKNEYYIYR